MPTVADLIDVDTVEYVRGMSSEDPFDEDTREFVRGILMEALSSQFDVNGFCDSLFALLDCIKITTDNPSLVPPKEDPTAQTTVRTKNNQPILMTTAKYIISKSTSYFQQLQQTINR